MYIPSFKLMSQSMLKKSPENADGWTDRRTLPRHNTSRFSNGRIKKIWNTLLTHEAPKQDCSDQQASKLLLISHWWERPKGCADTAVTCHSSLGCQDDNLCGCQDDLFLQNGSMHIPFRIHEILKILIANNSLKCIFFSLGKVQCKLHWSLPSSELVGTFQPTSLQHLIESTVQLIKWRSVW